MKKALSFGNMPNGDPVEKYTIKNNNGMEESIITLGCTLTSVIIPTPSGLVDVCLGYNNASEYLQRHSSMGAVCGRFANRIANGRFSLNNKTYQLAINNGPNHLHGGIIGYAYQIWNVSEYTESSVSFTKVSPDMEEGYPGKVNLKVTYALDDQNTLSIRYEAEADQDTILNLTNHSYWNLNGHDSGDAMNHLLQMPCSYFCPCDSNALVTGEIRSVAGTPFDFRSIHSIGSTIDTDDEQLKNGRGFDHCFLLDNSSPIILEGNLTKIRMEITTDMPAVQLYSANHLHEQTGKNNAMYFPRNSVCLETEQVPDAPNNPQFPSCVLKAGERFSSTTSHKFIY